MDTQNIIHFFDNLTLEYCRIILLPFLSGERLFFLYILTFILMACVIFFKKNHTLAGFFKFLLPKEIYTHQSTKIDIYLIFFSPFFNILLLTPLTVLATLWIAHGIMALLDSAFMSPMLEINAYSYIIYSILWIIFYDFGQYIAHYWEHKFPILWEFHKIHHSAEVLNPATAYRFHPCDMAFTSVVITACTSIITGLFSWLYGQELTFISILNMHCIIFLFYFCGYHFRHSHIKVIYPRWLQHILICPSQHQIHHSVEKKHWDKNIGYIFSVWDWLFGTLYIATHDEEYHYGLSKDQDATYRSLYHVYTVPFKNIFKILKQS